MNSKRIFLDHVLDHKKMNEKEVIEYCKNIVNDIYEFISDSLITSGFKLADRDIINYVKKKLSITKDGKYRIPCPICRRIYNEYSYEFFKDIKMNVNVKLDNGDSYVINSSLHSRFASLIACDLPKLHKQ